jgi:hypothetical protein
MALDFSKYGGPSEEWLAVEKTLPAITFDNSMDPVVLQKAVNTDRENRFAPRFAELSDQIHTKDYSIPTRDFPYICTSMAEASSSVPWTPRMLFAHRQQLRRE